MHQERHDTLYNRYPNIFKACADIMHPFKILSFGCSRGDEVFTLKDIYFKDCKIVGVDINEEVIKTCIENNTYTNVEFYTEIPEERYDIIFAMSVLCKWPNTMEIEDSSGVYEFKTFDEQLLLLHEKLELGGLLVLYNANFLFCDSSIFNKYRIITNEEIADSGFVHKFNKENKKIAVEYTDCIFMKCIE